MTKKGAILFHRRKPLYGIGINDSDYPVEIKELLSYSNGKQTYKTIWKCPFMQKWRSMLQRCYSESHLVRQPTYKGCSVCDEWLTFSNFKSWMEQQDWEGKALDKDLLVYQNTVYSPDTCVFVDRRVNNFLLKSDNKEGNILGSSWHTWYHKYQARVCSASKRCGLKFLGYYDTELEAHNAWQCAKIVEAKELISTQTNSKIIIGLQRVIDKIQNDYDSKLITEDF